MLEKRPEAFLNDEGKWADWSLTLPISVTVTPRSPPLRMTGKQLASGYGDRREGALHDLWIVPTHHGERERATYVAEEYRLLTGSRPKTAANRGGAAYILYPVETDE